MGNEEEEEEEDFFFFLVGLGAARLIKQKWTFCTGILDNSLVEARSQAGKDVMLVLDRKIIILYKPTASLQPRHMTKVIQAGKPPFKLKLETSSMLNTAAR